MKKKEMRELTLDKFKIAKLNKYTSKYINGGSDTIDIGETQTRTIIEKISNFFCDPKEEEEEDPNI